MVSKALDPNGSMEVSFIIPLLNEEQTITELCDRLNQQMLLVGINRYEIVFVNDGSTDGSPQVLDELHRKNFWEVLQVNVNV